MRVDSPRSDLAFSARLFGNEAAEKVAVDTEYEWHRDSSNGSPRNG